MGESSYKIVTFSSRILRERQRKRRLNPYVYIHRGPLEEPWLQVSNVPFSHSLFLENGHHTRFLSLCILLTYGKQTHNSKATAYLRLGAGKLGWRLTDRKVAPGASLG